MIGIEQTLHATAIVIGLAVSLQSLEQLLMRRAWSENGIYRWSIIRREYFALPNSALRMMDSILGDQGFRLLLITRFIAGAGLMMTPNAAVAGLALIATALSSLRWRGPFNGGSDYMTFLVLLTLTVALTCTGHPALQSACLIYLAIQTCLSYFLAGVVKVRKSSWRTGQALSDFLSLPYVRQTSWLKKIGDSPALCRALGWLVLIFEFAFPLSLANSQLCTILMATGLLFHLSVFYLVGLNRFILAWAAAYPALYFVSQI